jgi:hypothetical protein
MKVTVAPGRELRGLGRLLRADFHAELPDGPITVPPAAR